MTGKFKAVLTALAVAVLATALLVPVAGAGAPGGMMGSSTTSSSPSSAALPVDAGASWCGGGMWNGTGHWSGSGMWGTGSGASWLANNPDALQVWLQLRADHVAAMQAWRDAYKAGLTTPEAQQALHDLWIKNWEDMKAFYERYATGAAWTCPSESMWGGWETGATMGDHGWNAAHMWGTGHGASWMAHHPGALRQWLTMRAKQTAKATAWTHRYGDHLRSRAARSALKALRAHQRAQVKSFCRHHHLRVTSSRVRDGAAGWMGLGGMWGGFGW